jgi:putative DNA primase/helicase
MTRDLVTPELPEETRYMLELGMRLHPVVKNNKIPLLKNWPEQATTDPGTIALWLKRHPGCNWGIAAGRESGCFVLDVDGDAGRATVAKWCDEHGDSWLRTLAVSTGKGEHLYYLLPEEITIKNSVREIAPGIDIRSERGHVVAPGSIHPNGHSYRITNRCPVAAPEPWLLELLSDRPPKARPESTAIVATSSVTIPDGGRNTHLTSMAGVLRRKGCDLQTIETSLFAENANRCCPPLPEAEVRSIARSVSRYPSDYEPPSNEIALKDHFVDEQIDNLRIVNGQEWHLWESISKGGRWKRDATRFVEHEAQRFLRIQASFAQGGRSTAMASASTLRNVIALARADQRIALTHDRFDADPMLLNTPAGVFDFIKKEIRPVQREEYFSKITRVAPRNIPTLFWDSYLNQFHPEPERQRFLQRWCGYCLTGDTREQALVFGYGPAKGGKSTFVNIIAWIMGDYATTPSMDTFISDDHHSRHPADLAALVGARLAVSAETQEGRWWDEVKLKQCTGGDRITARFMRENFFTYLPQFKLFFVGNHRPRIRTVDDAMRRRFLIVPFDISLPEEKRIKGYESLLQEEASGILYWMLRGAVGWLHGEPELGLAKGLLPPQSIISASDDYMQSEDAPGQWFEECAERAQKTWTAFGELYTSYKEWAQENGMNVWSGRRFSTWLSEQGGLKAEKKAGGARGFRGVALKASPM